MTPLPLPGPDGQARDPEPIETAPVDAPRGREGAPDRHGRSRGGHREIRPIGPDRLRQLRRAIRDGTYPTDADVLGALAKIMFQGPAKPPPQGG